MDHMFHDGSVKQDKERPFLQEGAVWNVEKSVGT